MTRRDLLKIMAALPLTRAQKAQVLLRGVPPIPSGPAARWNFSTLGLAEGATISSVPDSSGNGNALSINTSLTHQTPLFTLQAINGRGGYWPGATVPSPAMTQSPACQPWGAFVSPSIALGNEDAISVLWCCQMGASSLSAANDARLMGIGGPLISSTKLEWWQEGSNSQASKPTHWYNAATSHGALANVAWVTFAGPNAGAFVNGYNATNGATCFMANRTRNVKSTMNWAANSLGTNPIFLGALLSGATDNPYGCVWHEVVIYNRVLTSAELDLWQLYCNREYGSPLISSGGGTMPGQKGRVILCGDSISDGQNATFGLTPANTMAAARGDFSRIEYINAGIGSSTLHSNWLVNMATWCDTLYDSTAGPNVFIWWRYFNDWNAGNSAATTETDITTFVSDIHALGGNAKVIVCTGTVDSGATGAVVTYTNTLNSWMTTGNPSGADFVGDMTAMQNWINANSASGHLNNAGYLELGRILKGILDASGLL